MSVESEIQPASVATHCPYCALQCGMRLVDSEGTESKFTRTLTVAPRPDFPTNKGGMCRKGWTAANLLTHPDRLTSPLLRNGDGVLTPATWDEALTFVVDRLTSIQARYGRDAVGIFGGGGLTNEKAYSLGKFARVALRTSNIDYNGRFCMSSAAAAGIKAFGIDRGLPFPLEDIPGAEAILLTGGNPAETMPPIMQYFDEQKRRGGKLIVADPRKTPTAALADLHLQLTPGSDAALANGLLHIAAAGGLIDEDFIAERTTGYDAVRRAVASYWPDRVERITGIPVAELTRAAHLMGEASTAMVLTARGTEQQSKGVDNTLAFINLILALGKAGKPHCGFGCITGQGNGQGGREHGQKADQLPGYRKIDNPEHRRYIASVWGVDEADIPGPGKSGFEMVRSLGQDGGVRGLMVFASNLLVSAPDANLVRDRLKSLELLTVSDIFLSETALLADVVLPCVQWAEEDGTMTNLEGRVIRRRKAQDPPEGARSDLDVIADLARRLGSDKFSDDPRTVFDELRRASAGGVADYSGITYERIDAENGVFWPCPGPTPLHQPLSPPGKGVSELHPSPGAMPIALDGHVVPVQPSTHEKGEGAMLDRRVATHPGTPRMFIDRFGTPDGKARFHSIGHRPAAEEPDDDYPLYLTTGRVMGMYQSGSQTRRVKELVEAFPRAFVEIHPVLAQRFGIVDGEVARITTRRGHVEVAARVTPTIRQDTLFIPFHWSGMECANLLTNTALDPTSKMPEFKICAAKIERTESQPDN